jgi:hypothetical protein
VFDESITCVPWQDTFTVLKKHAANIVIKSDATARDEVFTDVQVNLSGEQISRAPVRSTIDCQCPT